MVVMALPLATETGSWQERTATPSRCTVHAPHEPMPQPYFVPVRSSPSRSTHRSGMSSGRVDLLVLAVDAEREGGHRSSRVRGNA